MKILLEASNAHPAATEMSDDYRAVMVEQAKLPADTGCRFREAVITEQRHITYIV